MGFGGRGRRQRAQSERGWSLPLYHGGRGKKDPGSLPRILTAHFRTHLLASTSCPH